MDNFVTQSRVATLLDPRGDRAHAADPILAAQGRSTCASFILCDDLSFECFTIPFINFGLSHIAPLILDSVNPLSIYTRT